MTESMLTFPAPATVFSPIALLIMNSHRLLNELLLCGYARQLREHGDYVLMIKLPAFWPELSRRCGHR